MYHPTRKFQIYQLFAANTNLGKTLFSAGLCRASARPNKDSLGERQTISKLPFNKTCYLKPIQTGYPKSSDSKFVENLIDADMQVKLKTMFAYEEPVSPHLAVGRNQIPKDRDVLLSIKSYILEFARECGDNDGALFLETAGGVTSPVMSGTLQSDFYRPLRLPTILVGDSNLGGISATISSFESLYMRGYDIPIILLFENAELKNHNFLEDFFMKFSRNVYNNNKNNNVIVATVPPPPPLSSSFDRDQLQLKEYFNKNHSKFVSIIEKLNDWHHKRFDRLDEMGELTEQVVWWPFTQHKKVDNVNVIDSAFGDFMMVYEKGGEGKTDGTNEMRMKINKENIGQDRKIGVMKEMFDGSASWWTQGLGHGSSKLSLAASHAAGRYGHVIFPESIHEPALSLSQTLLRTAGYKWASRVFYSDNGSTAMEVALKMALKSSTLRYNFTDQIENVKILGMNGSYHGDTIGVMDACGPNVYNEQVIWYTPKGVWFDPPQIQMKNNIYNLKVPFTNQEFQYSSLNSLFSPSRKNTDIVSSIYKKKIEEVISSNVKEGYRFGALLIEPVLMGAGGMILVDPLFQRLLVEFVREWDHWNGGNVEGKGWNENDWKGLPVIYDEVFTGFWRLGRLSGADILGVTPDIATYAKLLTGGLLPLATTLTTTSIFNNFLGATKVDSLLHGHSYTAHPIGCMVANKAIEDGIWSMWSQEMIGKISCLPNVEGVFALGTVLAIELKDIGGGGYASEISFHIIKQLSNYSNDLNNDIAISSRPLGNVIYLIASLISQDKLSISSLYFRISFLCVNIPSEQPSSKRRKINDNYDDECLEKVWNALKNATVAGQFLQLSEDASYLLGKDDFGSNISTLFIRDCYLHLSEIIFGNVNIFRWRITSNPGIGKTFLDNIHDFKDYLGREEVWYIVDALEPMQCRAKIILICSPQKKYYKIFDQLGIDIRYMPVWSLTELNLCRDNIRIFQHLTRKTVRELYNKWGGIPRYVLFHALDSVQQSLLENAINLFDDKILNFVGEITDDNYNSSACHELVHICTNVPGEGEEDEENESGVPSMSTVPTVTKPNKRKGIAGRYYEGVPFYKKCTLEFASDHVSEKVVDRLSRNYKYDLQNFVNTSDDISEYSTLRGAIFERLAHQRLLRGGKFNFHPLFEDSKMRHTLQLDNNISS
ncbi:17384_t:CDS:10 [Acaulospora morrowiae]|uniref:17384_t:CDS:1 n=1 Tax=Acaulospora morrowiae TaxID=94023 RepID=A0A9N9ANW1_9GLOM|nr:17384_t:CDS:10 [Acaulospora morrowiae]